MTNHTNRRRRRNDKNKMSSEVTQYCWCPKLNAVLQLVDSQILCSDFGEFTPTIRRYRFPGPVIDVRIGGVDVPTTLTMTVEYTNGVTGAVHLLTDDVVDDGLRSALEQAAHKIGMHLTVIDLDYFINNLKTYATWKSMVRYLHSCLDPDKWPVTQDVLALFVDHRKLTVEAVIDKAHLDSSTGMVAVAHLVHSGKLEMDCAEARFCGMTRVWKARPVTEKGADDGRH